MKKLHIKWFDPDPSYSEYFIDGEYIGRDEQLSINEVLDYLNIEYTKEVLDEDTWEDPNA